MKRVKWLSVLLSTVMILAVIPTIVSAAGAEASADGVEYPTLQEAIAAGGNNQRDCGQYIDDRNDHQYSGNQCNDLRLIHSL